MSEISSQQRLDVFIVALDSLIWSKYNSSIFLYFKHILLLWPSRQEIELTSLISSGFIRLHFHFSVPIFIFNTHRRIRNKCLIHSINQTRGLFPKYVYTSILDYALQFFQAAWDDNLQLFKKRTCEDKNISMDISDQSRFSLLKRDENPGVYAKLKLVWLHPHSLDTHYSKHLRSEYIWNI